MAKKNTKKKGIKLNMDDVKTGYKAIPEGIYSVKVQEAELSESQKSGQPKIEFKFEVIEGKHKGSILFHTCSLQPQALFNLKALLLALGYEIPSGEFDLDVEELIDLECQVEVAHEKYEGKDKARIVEFIPLDEDGDDEEDEEPEDDEDEDEDEDDEEEDEEEPDYESMTLKELKAAAKEAGIKVTKGMSKEDIIELLSDDEEEDDEDEDDEEADYESMTLKELKAEAKERGLKVKKGMSKEDIIELLEEDDEE